MPDVQGKMKVVRIEYETKDRTNWKAVIIAYSIQDAVDYIKRNVPTFDKYISTMIVGDVDGIEMKVANDYLVKTEVVETVIRAPEAEVKQPKPANEVGVQNVCPWCEKPFKSKNTLGTHIKKYHLDE